jgi:hypothetical protein
MYHTLVKLYAENISVACKLRIPSNCCIKYESFPKLVARVEPRGGSKPYPALTLKARSAHEYNQ